MRLSWNIFTGANETQRLFVDNGGGSYHDGSSGGSDYGVDRDSDHGATADRGPDEPFDAVTGETVVVVDAAERVRRGRFEVFEKGVQDGGGGQQSVHHIQGEQGKPEEAGEIVGAEGEESHQDPGHSSG